MILCMLASISINYVRDNPLIICISITCIAFWGCTLNIKTKLYGLLYYNYITYCHKSMGAISDGLFKAR